MEVPSIQAHFRFQKNTAKNWSLVYVLISCLSARSSLIDSSSLQLFPFSSWFETIYKQILKNVLCVFDYTVFDQIGCLHTHNHSTKTLHEERKMKLRPNLAYQAFRFLCTIMNQQRFAARYSQHV